MSDPTKEPQYNPRNIVAKTGNYTATVADDLINVSAAATITLPAISALAASNLGSKTFKIVNTGTANVLVTISPATGETIGGAASYTLTINNDYVILTSNPTTLQWDIGWPANRTFETNLEYEVITLSLAAGSTSVQTSAAITNGAQMIGWYATSYALASTVLSMGLVPKFTVGSATITVSLPGALVGSDSLIAKAVMIKPFNT